MRGTVAKRIRREARQRCNPKLRYAETSNRYNVVYARDSYWWWIKKLKREHRSS